jgi:hypothetical protein
VGRLHARRNITAELSRLVQAVLNVDVALRKDKH